MPSVLGNSQAFTEMVGKVVALYSSGDKAGAIATFAEEVTGANFREVFDQKLYHRHHHGANHEAFLLLGCALICWRSLRKTWMTA